MGFQDFSAYWKSLMGSGDLLCRGAELQLLLQEMRCSATLCTCHELDFKVACQSQKACHLYLGVNPHFNLDIMPA